MNTFILLRPSHWVKNILVFVPLFFGGAMHDGQKATAAFVAYVAFCLVASGGYAWNDMFDQKENASHNRKKIRPVAANTISPLRAGIVGFAATTAGLTVAMAFVPTATLIIGIYTVLNALYSFRIKRVPILELIFFPAFYLSRIFAGGAAVRIVPSNWLILCVIFISLFIIIIKRNASANERVYPEKFLNLMTAIFGSAALISYGLYSILVAQSPYAVYSIVFPIGGIMRYLMLTEKEGEGEYPEKIFVRDPFIVSCVVLWAVFMYALLY